MRKAGSLIVVLLAVSLVVSGQAGKIVGDQEPEIAAASVEIRNGSVAVTDADGSKTTLADPDGVRVVAPEFRLVGDGETEFEVQETFRFGKAFTTVTNGKTCMIIERDLDEPAPKMTFTGGDGDTAPGMSFVWPRCGGCMIAGRSEVDEDALTCRPGCDDCTCQHCWSGPCPPRGGRDCENNPDDPLCDILDIIAI